jgi:hypothetical protein
MRLNFGGAKAKAHKSGVQSVGAFATGSIEIERRLSTTRAHTRTGHTATEIAGKATSRVGGGEMHLL